MIADLKKWASAVCRAWYGWVGGSATVGMVSFGQSLNWWAAPPKSVYLALLIFGLLFSTFQAWRAEHQNVIRKTSELELMRSVPDFGIEFGQVSNGLLGDRTLVTVTARIVNARGPRSALFDWSIHLQFKNSGTIMATDAVAPGSEGVTATLGQTGKKQLLERDSFFPYIRRVVDAGDFIEGWFWAAFQNVELFKANDQCLIVFGFKDAVSNTVHQHTFPLRKAMELPSLLKDDWIPASAKNKL